MNIGIGFRPELKIYICNEAIPLNILKLAFRKHLIRTINERGLPS